MINDHGYIDKAVANIREVAEKQADNIHKAAELMADAIEADRLINVYAGGGHTTLAMGEMFFRAGGLANINPLMETALSVFNQALKYLELERTVNFGASIVKYYDIQKDDVVLFFHNIGINPATIDAAMEVKKRGAKLIAVASSYWQNEMPPDHFIRHPNHRFPALARRSPPSPTSWTSPSPTSSKSRRSTSASRAESSRPSGRAPTRPEATRRTPPTSRSTARA